MTHRAHVALYDGLADWEIGHLLVELRTGRFTGRPWTVVTVAESPEPIITMGGLRVTPDLTLDDLHAEAGDLLILPGADTWDGEGHAVWVDTAATFLERGTPVAAICGATAGLASGGLLDARPHTSAALEYLENVPGYRGSDHYLDRRAVASDGLVTAGPQSPIHFAAAVLGELGLASQPVLDAYLRVFHDGDASGYGELMGAHA